ncbi:MAG: TIGR02266 family protein [Deltaproteobacteria bacterium]|nr:TIGR02266 family protein [Deltaproteobacteria bacterium]
MAKDERRSSERVPADVKVDYRTVGSFITDYSANLSKGGVFVRTSIPLRVGEHVRLRITLPGNDLPFGLEGVVRWTNTGADEAEAGMGIEFVNFEGEVRDRLRSFVDMLEAQGG